MSIEATGTTVLDAAFAVHRSLGPGLLESVYEQCLVPELQARGLEVRTQVTFPIRFRGHELDSRLRIDLLVDEKVIVEAKAVSQLTPVHRAQLLTYLRVSRLRLGYLLNFNSETLRDGLERVVN